MTVLRVRYGPDARDAPASHSKWLTVSEMLLRTFREALRSAAYGWIDDDSPC